MPDIRILTEAELRSQISLDLSAIECVEQAFHALATKSVVMPPIMRYQRFNGFIQYQNRPGRGPVTG